MGIWTRVRKKLPVFRYAQTCEACGRPFACEIGADGCWCSRVAVSAATREALRARYRRCVCRECLEEAEARFAQSP